ncbi:MAG: hypothetical protein HEQ39_02015 [Rhizobacter sp.]
MQSGFGWTVGVATMLLVTVVGCGGGDGSGGLSTESLGGDKNRSANEARSRAQTGLRTPGVNSNGQSALEFDFTQDSLPTGAHTLGTPRFSGTAPEVYPRKGLLIEPATRNLLSNPGGLGGRDSGTVISNADMPIGWSVVLPSDDGQMKLEISGKGLSADGLPYVDMRFYGVNSEPLDTTDAPGMPVRRNLDRTYVIGIESSGATNPLRVEPGTNFALTLATQYLSGSISVPAVNISNASPELAFTQLRFDYLNAANSSVVNVSRNFMIETQATVQAFTEQAPSRNGIVRVRPQLRVSIPNSATYDFTLRLSGLQFETGSTPTSVGLSGDRSADQLDIDLPDGSWLVAIQTPVKTYVQKVEAKNGTWRFSWPDEAMHDGVFRLQRLRFARDLGSLALPAGPAFDFPNLGDALEVVPNELTNEVIAPANTNVWVKPPRHRIYGAMFRVRGGNDITVLGGHFKPYPVLFWTADASQRGDSATEAALRVSGFSGTAHMEGVLTDTRLARGADGIAAIPVQQNDGQGHIVLYRALMKGVHGMNKNTAGRPARHADGFHIRTSDYAAAGTVASGRLGEVNIHTVTVRTAYQAMMLTAQASPIDRLNLTNTNFRYEGSLLDANSYLVNFRDAARGCLGVGVPVVTLDNVFLQERLAHVDYGTMRPGDVVPLHRLAIQPDDNQPHFNPCKPIRSTVSDGEDAIQYDPVTSGIHGILRVVRPDGSFAGQPFVDMVSERDVGALYRR